MLEIVGIGQLFILDLSNWVLLEYMIGIIVLGGISTSHSCVLTELLHP